MRAIALLAAIITIHTAHALPRPDLAVRQDGNDLGNESHVFHHLDRNPRTANQHREPIDGNDAKGSGVSVVKRVLERPQRAEVAREREVDRRFMESPDYSQGGGPGGGSSSVSSASDTMPTQQPTAKAEKHT